MSVIHQLLTQYWGHSKFRPLQEEIITSVLEGRDTLALLPTGGGKSICFQVPAMAKEGLCLVISPLIALMKDQEEQLKNKGIRAVAIVSGMKKSEVDIALDNCTYGNYKFLYVSPERLESETFIERLLQMNINLIAIDEAHCISQWGYDFRPPYLRIANIRDYFPNVPVLALTASATPEVRDDICDRLRFKNHQVFAKSFARSNLSYLVRKSDNKNEHLLKALRAVSGSSIVYVRNRRKTQDLAMFLNKNGISANFYHAGLDHQTRSERQDRWKNNQTRVIVATNAFGMGIDKPDVRMVIHMDLPDNLESYYQEAGRAGRDEKPAFAMVLYSNNDLLDLERRMSVGFPTLDEIKKVYQSLSNYLQLPINAGEGLVFEFELLDFATNYKMDPVRTYNCLKILELENYLTLTDAVYLPSRIYITLKHIALYTFQVQHANYDHLIKTILRSYSGVFDDYVRFSETELARRAMMDLQLVKAQLKELHKLEVIHYIPNTDQPRIYFNQQRVDLQHLHISKENLELRKERFVVRAEAFKRYVTDAHHCRSMMLLSYFGEKNLQRCGTCDYCRERNKLDMNDLEMAELSREIFALLKEAPLITARVTERIPGYSTEKITAAIRWLLDNGDLGLDALGRIYHREN